MFKRIKDSNKASGFTIIEVMIVLAIAGLIMAIVFLAVPALQRNARNTQRSSDSSRTLAAIGECLSNKNGQVASCNTTALVTPFFNVGTNQQLTVVAITAAAPAAPAAGTVSTLNIGFGAKCTSSGDGLDATGTISPRGYAGLYRVETSGGDTLRCVSS